MAETRINLKHLLENLRDSYPFSIEEAILTELVANSLDSRANVVNILVSPDTGTLRIVDNGLGMGRSDFRQYHDIAASNKVRGQGIGFAGVGAKLALLLCQHVDTETRHKKVYLQSRWQLLKADRARWEFGSPDGQIPSDSGTAVTLHFRRQDTPLLDVRCVGEFVRKHFRPLLDSFFYQVLRTVYPSRVTIALNGQPLRMEGFDAATAVETFVVRIPPRNRAAGIGFLSLSAEPLPEDLQGLAISTFGKVIKRGWDWLALTPRRPEQVTGLVEIPDLASILTLNKADFLKTPSTLRKYYRYRNSIQRVVQPILEDFGEAAERKATPEISRPLERELESVLSQIIPEFPELEPLVGMPSRGGMNVPVAITTRASQQRMDEQSDEPPPDQQEPKSVADSVASAADEERSTTRKKSGLHVGFDDALERADLGWMSGNTIWINRAHPAFLRNQKSNSQSFHIALTVALVLSGHLLDERSPQQFVSEFLALWGKTTGERIPPLYQQQLLSDKVH